MFFPLHDDNPTLRRPIATWTLILLNFMVWIFLQGAGIDEESFLGSVEVLSLPPASVFTTDISSPLLLFLASGLTSMFAHAGWAHLLGNMWFLWIFGNNVEDSMTRVKFLCLYLVSGYIGCLAHLVVGPDVQMIGASGAVSGISIAYILLYPRCRIYSALVILRFIWIFRIPASVLVGAHLLIDIGSVSFHLEDGVAYWAHLGGAVTGAALIYSLVDVERLKAHPHHGWRPTQKQPLENPRIKKVMIERIGYVISFVFGIAILLSTDF